MVEQRKLTKDIGHMVQDEMERLVRQEFLTQSRRNLLGQMVNRGYVACGPSAGGSSTLADELVTRGLAEFASEFSGTRYYKITDAGRAALNQENSNAGR